jgi:polar amino acid transport system substrate-binding protein
MKRRLLTLLMMLLGSFLRAEDYLLLTLQYPPYEYQETEKGEVKGLAVEVVRQAFARMGHTVTIKLLPWPRVLWMVENGHADGFFTTYHVPEREQWADYSTEELAPQVTSLFVKKGSRISYRGDLNQLAGEPIGVVMKVSYGEKFDRAVKDKVLTRVLESVDGETNFRQLFAGRLNVVASNRLGAQFILGQMGKIDEVEELAPPLENVPSYIAFSKAKNLKPLRDRFDQVLRQMKADGTWARIMKQVGP